MAGDALALLQLGAWGRPPSARIPGGNKFQKNTKNLFHALEFREWGLLLALAL